VTINRRQFLRDFDLMTCIAAALGIVFLAVLVEAGLRQDFQRQERVNDANDSKAVDRDGAEEGDRPLASRRQGQDANGGPAGGVLAGQLQPCAGNATTARRVRLFVVTAYCPCKICCGPRARGITASGKPVTANGGLFVAADKSVPFGTQISIPGYNGGKPVPVLDRGGAIRGNRLDVYVPTHRTALIWGRQQLVCEVLN